MAGLVTNQGERIIMEALFNLGLTLKLFKNDYTPVDGTTEANMTEATFPGYAPLDFDSAADWNITPGAPTEASLASQHFEADDDVVPAQTIYGYYFVDTYSGELVWAERFATPRVLILSGDYLNIVPKLQLKKVGE